VSDPCGLDKSVCSKFEDHSYMHKFPTERWAWCYTKLEENGA
jgi:hypothetical protein